ncbi:hypothetical protein SAMN05421788_107292 [Filimonas lacunae]|uniref:DUF5018 domain-containing protein n=2 Tax=Filimonas lacunae TaxID=477680 RepID=A0A173MG83_9BACT|nr:hypothetical protein FLA_2651 [Filimonas lacunae]SIT27673.1 hypothetical protein SAMN05421788_107292 [Filimonas lacunae]
MRIKKASNVLLTLAGLFLLSSCKKTVDYEHEPANQVTSYKVAVSDGYLYGSINNIDNTITLYVPFYYELTVVDPEITVSVGAALKEEILPVPITDTAVYYTVVGSDGSTRKYKLDIEVQKIGVLTVSEQSSATYTATYSPNENIEVGGMLNTVDIGKVHVSLVNKITQKSTALSGDGTSAYTISVGGNNTAYVGGLRIPGTLDTGLYYIRVKVYNDSVQSQYPIRLVYTQPQLLLLNPTATVGGTFTIQSYNTVITRLNSVSGVIDGVTYQFPVVSQTATTIVVSVPATFKAGSYITTFTVLFNGWESFTTTTTLAIT